MLMMLAVVADDNDALCWLRLMLTMLAGSANDQWAADTHDAFCWERPIDGQMQHWCADAHNARGSCPRPPVDC